MLLELNSDPKKSLLIYIHGGPLVPEVYLVDKYFSELTEEFNCVFPDQYGCGLSFTSERNVLPLDVYAQDIVEITRHYLNITNTSSAILLGSSFGTVTGLLAISRAEYLYSHYIDIGQIKNIYESLKAAREYILSNSDVHDKKVDTIQSSDSSIDYLISSKYLNASMNLLSKLRKQNTFKAPFSSLDTLKALFFFKGYHSSTKINILKNLFDKRTPLLLKELAKVDMQDTFNNLTIPTIILQGEHDLVTNYQQAKLMVECAANSKNRFITIREAAHVPYLDKPGKEILEIIKESL